MGKAEVEPVSILTEVERALTDPTAKLSVVEDVDSEEAMRRIVSGILTSDDPFAPRNSAIGGRDILGVPIRVTAVDWRNSDLKGEGLGIFAVLHATTQNGKQVVVTTGGRSVLAQMFVAVRDGLLPADVCFVEGTETRAGYKPLWLEAAKWEEGGF